MTCEKCRAFDAPYLATQDGGFLRVCASCQIERLSQENEALMSRIDTLRDCLLWYVENDDTNDSEYNQNWLDGKRRALLALGLEGTTE